MRGQTLRLCHTLGIFLALFALCATLGVCGMETLRAAGGR